MLVLVYEDDKAILENVCEIFAMDGHGVIGQTRWQPDPILRNAPDLIIVDLMLHNHSGITWAEHIRRDWKGPMIAISADGNLLNIALRSGFFAAGVAKPFDIVDLLQIVHQVMAERTIVDIRDDLSR